MKHSTRRTLTIVLTGTLLLIAAVGCGGTKSPTSTPFIQTATPPSASTQAAPAKPTAATQANNTPAPTSAPTATTAANDAPQSANLGDVIQQDGYFVQAAAVEDPTTPGLLYQAESGKKLVAVELVVGNVSGSALSVNPLNATLIDNDGFAYHPELAARDGQLGTLDLNPGEKVDGWVAFKVPNEAKPKTIKYELTFGSTPLQSALTPPTTKSQPAKLPARTAPKLAKLGDVVQQDGYSLSASSVEDPGKPGFLFKAEKGKRMVAVQIVVGNVSGAKISTNALYAILVDTNGFLYEEDLGAHDGQLDVVDLNPGEKAKGWVAFEIPTAAKLEGIKYNVSGDITLETGLTK